MTTDTLDPRTYPESCLTSPNEIFTTLLSLVTLLTGAASNVLATAGETAVDTARKLTPDTRIHPDAGPPQCPITRTLVLPDFVPFTATSERRLRRLLANAMLHY